MKKEPKIGDKVYTLSQIGWTRLFRTMENEVIGITPKKREIIVKNKYSNRENIGHNYKTKEEARPYIQAEHDRYMVVKDLKNWISNQDQKALKEVLQITDINKLIKENVETND